MEPKQDIPSMSLSNEVIPDNYSNKILIILALRLKSEAQINN